MFFHAQWLLVVVAIWSSMMAAANALEPVAVQDDDTVYVLHVKGDIKIKRTGVLIQEGDEIAAHEQLSFLDKQAKAVVIDDNGVKKMLQLNSDVASHDSEFVAVLNEVLNPFNVKNAQLSTRSSQFAPIHNLHDYFTEEPFSVLGTKLTLHFDLEQYQLSSGVGYMNLIKNVDGFEQVLKLESNADNSILFDLAKHFDNDERVANNFILEYWLVDTALPQVDATVCLRFIDEQRALKQVEIIERVHAKQSDKVSQGAVQREIYDFFTRVYGNLDYGHFSEWYRQHSKLN
ncbi:hypothetical protein GCM10023331_26540 [Algivirga pacifica]|uniref:DUF3857 domain-containing protein n=2 Tax=Algivirga pacifica TaxID=1162670 RepID=A0ABP9DCG7_9BACT